MGITLTQPAVGSTDWGMAVNTNWQIIQDVINGVRNMNGTRMDYSTTTTVKLNAFTGQYVEVNGSFVDCSSGLTLATGDDLITSTGADSGGAMGASTLYYVYVSNASASYAASSLRASTTAPNAFNGVKYLGTSENAANWRFVGWVYTSVSTTFTDSDTSRCVVNYYNRLRKRLFICPNYNDNNVSTTYTFNSNGVWSSSFAGAGVTSYVDYISNGEDSVSWILSGALIPAATAAANLGFGDDSNSTASCYAYFAPNVFSTHTAHWIGTPAVGRRTGYMLALTSDANNATVYADAVRFGGSRDEYLTFLSGMVMT